MPDGLGERRARSAEPGQALVVHPGVRAVSFTGSVPTGRIVAAAAMATGPRLVSLELGGKNAMIVLPDADLALAADGALFGAFGTAGQRCTSTSRLIVHRDVADQLRRHAHRTRRRRCELGDPTDPDTDVGPVIDRHSAERIDGMVQARDRGRRRPRPPARRSWRSTDATAARSTHPRSSAACSGRTASPAKRCSARCSR